MEETIITFKEEAGGYVGWINYSIGAKGIVAQGATKEEVIESLMKLMVIKLNILEEERLKKLKA